MLFKGSLAHTFPAILIVLREGSLVGGVSVTGGGRGEGPVTYDCSRQTRGRRPDFLFVALLKSLVTDSMES